MSVVTVGSEAVLFPVFNAASPPPETLALFVTEAAAVKETSTAKLKTLVLLPATLEIAVLLAQVIVCGAVAFERQDQLATFVPLSATVPASPPLTLKPVGKLSVTVIVPVVVGAVPLFVTVIVYVPGVPRVKLPVCVLAIVKSGSKIGVLTVLEFIAPEEPV